MSDRIQEIRAKVTEATKALREQIPPQTDYAEMVGAPAWAYGQRFVWDDPSHYAMDNAADLLDDLLAQLYALESENAKLREAIKTARDRCVEQVEKDFYFVDAWELLDMLPAAPQEGE